MWEFREGQSGWLWWPAGLLFWQIICFRSYYTMIFLWRWRVILWFASVLLATWTTHTVAVLFYVMIFLWRWRVILWVVSVLLVTWTTHTVAVLFSCRSASSSAWEWAFFSVVTIYFIFFNPLSPHDACKHHFTSLKTNSIFLQNEYFHESGLPIHSNFLLIFTYIKSSSSTASNSRLVVDEDDNGKFRLDRVKYTNNVLKPLQRCVWNIQFSVIWKVFFLIIIFL